MELLTFNDVLEEVQLTPSKLKSLPSDIDINGDKIERWVNNEHGERIIIEHYLDGLMVVESKLRGYYDGYVDGYLHETA